MAALFRRNKPSLQFADPTAAENNQTTNDSLVPGTTAPADTSAIGPVAVDNPKVDPVLGNGIKGESAGTGPGITEPAASAVGKDGLPYGGPGITEPAVSTEPASVGFWDDKSAWQPAHLDAALDISKVGDKLESHGMGLMMRDSLDGKNLVIQMSDGTYQSVDKVTPSGNWGDARGGEVSPIGVGNNTPGIGGGAGGDPNAPGQVMPDAVDRWLVNHPGGGKGGSTDRHLESFSLGASPNSEPDTAGQSQATAASAPAAHQEQSVASYVNDTTNNSGTRKIPVVAHGEPTSSPVSDMASDFGRNVAASMPAAPSASHTGMHNPVSDMASDFGRNVASSAPAAAPAPHLNPVSDVLSTNQTEQRELAVHAPVPDVTTPALPTTKIDGTMAPPPAITFPAQDQFTAPNAGSITNINPAAPSDHMQHGTNMRME
jgi:hypothetical protein